MRLQHLTILIFINLYFSSALQPINFLNRCKSLLKNPFLSKSDATSLHKQLQERQISPFLPFSRSLYSTICSPTVLSEELRGRRNIPQLIRLFLLFLPSFLLTRPRLARASISVSQAAKESTGVSPVQGLILWFVLFATSASLHAAESAITKLSQWKIQELAEEEGKKSPFATLSEKLTQLLSTILITSTTCSIYSTALFVTTASAFFPSLGLGSITIALTLITLFFGELLPKALAVANSELVARRLVPAISRLSQLLSPITSMISVLSNAVLATVGLRSVEDKNVSEDMVRRVVAEAQATLGIETAEGRMIHAVLDLRDRVVERVMTPRVDIVSVNEDAPASEILQLAMTTKYSRIPVCRRGVDDIVGIVFSKDLLQSISLQPHNVSAATPSSSSSSSSSSPLPLATASSWDTLTAGQLMEPTFYIPETMSSWAALQEMRKRRVHMCIVVDEYGGTSGLVTFEDILEEVVGEIYDEDDLEEVQTASSTIFEDSTTGNFEIKAIASLDDVCDALGLELSEEVQNEYSTFGGYLTKVAGAIPEAGDEVMLPGYICTVVEVDARRIISVQVRRAPSLEESRADNRRNAGDSSSDHEDGSDAENGGCGTDSLLSSSSNPPNNNTPWSGGSRYFSDGEWVDTPAFQDNSIVP